MTAETEICSLFAANNVCFIGINSLFLKSALRKFWRPQRHDCASVSVTTLILDTAQKMKFSNKDFSSKSDQIRRKLRTWSHLLKKSLMKTSSFVK